MTAERFLLWLLRLNAAVLLLAAPCALLPFTSMAWVHREVLGLGPLPDMPIIRYMGRSLSILYATYGLITLYITISWPRYREVVPLVAWLHVAFGAAMLAVDRDAGMPWWWVAAEGPPLAIMGLVMLALFWKVGQRVP